MHTPITLVALNAALDDCACCSTVERNCRHVPGGGCDDRPAWMLVFINPVAAARMLHALHAALQD